VITEGQAQTLVQIVDLVRSGSAVTRPDLVRTSELGRAVITQRLEQLIALNLIIEGDVLAVPRGRSPRGLQFNRLCGHVLAADIGAQGIFVGLSDLAGGIVERVYIPHDVTTGPDHTLKVVTAEFDKILRNREDFDVHLWGVGIGVPGPVEFATGKAVSPPIMPGWNDFDIRGVVQERYGVPVWIDNDVNAMALGELRTGAAVNHRDVVVLKLSTGIGAGLISNGRLHRGSQGAAGDIGHVKVSDDPSVLCSCGNTGCLEALAGGWALAMRGAELVARGESPFLADRAQQHPLAAADIVAGAASGDRASVVLMTESARLVGDTLARIVNFFNPSLILLGGRLMLAGDAYLATVRNIVYSRSLPLATRELVIGKVALGERAALHGAVALALDEIFRPSYFAQWAGENSVPTVL